MIYLDNAATTLIKPAEVGWAVQRAMRTMASPGRGGHAPAMRAAEEVYACREAAAELFGVEDPARVVFTCSATHALNLAIHSLAGRGTRVLLSGFEHNAVTRPLHAARVSLRIAGRRLFDPASLLEEWEAALPWAQLAVCTHVSNVFGYVLPIEELAALCRRRGVPLIVDASQSAGVLPVDMRALGAAFIAMPGHKALFGPQGTGLLLCGRDGEPLMQGGSGTESRLQQMPEALPERLEAGTHNVCGIAGLRAGIDYVRRTGTDAILRHERKLLALMRRELADSGLRLFTGPAERQCGVLSLLVPGLDSEEAAIMLSERSVCVRAGLHCAPTAHESAGTLESGTVRCSFSPFVTEEEVLSACAALRELAARAE